MLFSMPPAIAGVADLDLPPWSLVTPQKQGDMNPGAVFWYVSGQWFSITNIKVSEKLNYKLTQYIETEKKYWANAENPYRDPCGDNSDTKVCATLRMLMLQECVSV